jgi:hypothetical protein
LKSILGNRAVLSQQLFIKARWYHRDRAKLHEARRAAVEKPLQCGTCTRLSVEHFRTSSPLLDKGVNVDIQFPGGGNMSKFERVVVADSTASPDCRCSAEMDLIAIVSSPGGDSEVRIFRCPECNHELRLTVWHNDLSPANIGGLLRDSVCAGGLGIPSRGSKPDD